MEEMIKDLQAAVKTLSDERRSHWDRRQEFQDWSENVYKTIEGTQTDVTDVKKDVKELTAAMAGMYTAVELLKKDHEHADERWEELKKILEDIKKNGCEYTHASKPIAAAAFIREKIKKDRVGHTWPDLVAKLTPANVTLTAIIALLVLLLMYHDKVAAFLGFG